MTAASTQELQPGRDFLIQIDAFFPQETLFNEDRKEGRRREQRWLATEAGKRFTGLLNVRYSKVWSIYRNCKRPRHRRNLSAPTQERTLSFSFPRSTSSLFIQAEFVRWGSTWERRQRTTPDSNGRCSRELRAAAASRTLHNQARRCRSAQAARQSGCERLETAGIGSVCPIFFLQLGSPKVRKNNRRIKSIVQISSRLLLNAWPRRWLDRITSRP
jgi:hypothetical protein